MSLTEKFRPTSRQQLVGNSKAISKLEDCLLSSKTCLLHGPPGTGKTSSVRALANDIGFRVCEWNASDSRKKEDFVQILRETKSRSFTPTVFCLDEIDGCEDFKGVEECIKFTKNPLVLIANNVYKVPKSISELCEQIRFYEPQMSEVTEVIRKIEQTTGLKADYSRMSRDVRNSILNCFYGSEKYSSQTVFEEVEDLFKRGKTKQLNQDHFIWLLDNGCLQFKGKKLYDFYKLLDVCDRLNNFTPLSMVNGGKEKIEYPRYIKRLQVLRRKRDDNT